MARPQEFDRDQVLTAAIKTFSKFGYDGTSTDVLLKSMGISRQSMYNTFGDKKRLYLEALQSYSFESIGNIASTLQSSNSPMAAIEATLLGFVLSMQPSSESGCLGVGAICEFGRRDREIAAISDATSAALQNVFEAAVQRAKDKGEVASDVKPKDAALFLGVTLTGLKVAARSGAKPEALRAIAHTALRSLK